MSRFVALLVGFALASLASVPALGQGQPVNLWCWNSAATIGADQYKPCNSTTPLQVAGTITVTPSGTQDVNITQVLGAAPSATNPIWVAPATASTPWAVTGSGAAGTAAAGVVTVQGIASMTPVQVSQATASSLNATVVGSSASGAALAGNPVRVGISDGTNAQNLLAAIALSDGVNGNNTAAVGGWVWNGATWDRMPGSTTGVTVKEAGASFVNITTNTDTNVKGSAGTLVGFSVNTVGVTSTVKFYNDADGTCSSGLIGTFSTLAQTYVQIPAAATIGICAQTAGGSPADITVYYR